MSENTNRYKNATDFLAGLDDDWAQLIEAVGECTFEPKLEREPYEVLIRTVAYQQMHTKTGDAIIKRLLNIYDNAFPSPSQLLETEFEILKACGFSALKIETLKRIAEGSNSGLVPTRKIADAMTDEDLIQQLVKLKGIGRWTVEMLLIFTIGRMDVLPADDIGIINGYKRLKKIKTKPNKKEIAEIGKAWRPYRTIASWYLWRVPK